VVEQLDWLDLELKIASLPLISRGAHLKGPILHAQRLKELWKAAGEVVLGEVFRLLPDPIVADVLLRATASDDYAVRSDPRHWTFPSLEEVVRLLRAQAWQELLAGRFVITAIVQGKRKRRGVKPVELAHLEPDWTLGRLQSGGVDRFVDVRVRPKPEPKLEPEFKSPTVPDWKDAVEKLPPNLTEAGRHKALEGLLGGPLRRDDARGAVKQYRPGLVKRGRPRKKKSRQ
jgi:hypothetical protein